MKKAQRKESDNVGGEENNWFFLFFAFLLPFSFHSIAGHCNFRSLLQFVNVLSVNMKDSITNENLSVLFTEMEPWFP